MIKNILVILVILIWTIGISIAVMQSIEVEREARKLDKEFKQAVIESVQNSGGCK